VAAEDEVTTAVAELPADINNDMLPPVSSRRPEQQQQRQQWFLKPDAAPLIHFTSSHELDALPHAMKALPCVTCV
jgi:hypothetical protein